MTANRALADGDLGRRVAALAWPAEALVATSAPAAIAIAKAATASAATIVSLSNGFFSKGGCCTRCMGAAGAKPPSEAEDCPAAAT